MLASMSNAVVTINEEGKIITCNKAGLKILRVTPAEILDKSAEQFFSNGRSWMFEKVQQCNESKENILLMDVTFEVGNEESKNKDLVSLT